MIKDTSSVCFADTFLSRGRPGLRTRLPLEGKVARRAG